MGEKTKKVFTATEEDIKLLNSISKEEQDAFSKLDDANKINAIAYLHEKYDNVSAPEVTFEEAKEEDDRYPMIGIANENHPVGLKAGDKMTFRLRGSVPVFSKEHKENWDVITFNGQKFYKSMFYEIENLKGEKRGLFAMGGLHLLAKVPTRSSNTGAKDPLVKMTYVGLIHGKEVLKEKYGMELLTGDKAHVFQLEFEQGTLFNRYAKGVQNYLRPPFPTFAKSVGEIDLDENQIAMANWEKQQQARSSGAIGYTGEAQKQIQ